MVSILFIVIPSHYLAGHLGDKYAETKPQMKGYLACLSGLIGFPLTLIAFAVSQNFWISMF